MTTLANPFLQITSDTLDGIEDLRIATENRYRALTREAIDKDGVDRSLGLSGTPEARRMQEMLASLTALEHQSTLEIKRTIRKHPLGGWVKANRGIGEKQAARLIAALGDPYWNDLHDRPRTVSELWAYCGYSVVDGAAQRRQKGQKANWSPTAKMRVFLIAESCVKTGDRYRKIYDDARAQYGSATHTVECLRCGPKGKPAQPGSALSANHQHHRALRKISKEILKDIWLESKKYHEAQASV